MRWKFEVAVLRQDYTWERRWITISNLKGEVEEGKVDAVDRVLAGMPPGPSPIAGAMVLHYEPLE